MLLGAGKMDAPPSEGGCKCKTWPPWGSSELGENVGPYGGWMLLRAGGGGNVVPLR